MGREARGMSRAALLAELARVIVAAATAHPLRVAIDGVDAAGKTTLADELVAPVRALGRPVVRASVDSFHQPARIRYRRGADSPDGYFRDSFDYDALISCLLAPLGPGGSRRVRTAVFDHAADRSIDAPALPVAERAVLLVDGIFLQRPELRSHWDLAIFVQAGFEVTLARALARDRERSGSAEQTRRRYRERYVPGQRLYLEECRPARCADFVVVNDDLENPTLIARPG